MMWGLCLFSFDRKENRGSERFPEPPASSGCDRTGFLARPPSLNPYHCTALLSKAFLLMEVESGMWCHPATATGCAFLAFLLCFSLP